MHKLIHINKKKMAAKSDKLLFLLNLPCICVFAALVVIVNVIMRFTAPPVSMYRVVFYTAFCCTAVSFVISVIVLSSSGRKIKNSGEYTYIEITDSAVVFSEHEKSVSDGKDYTEHIILSVIKLVDIEDAFTENGKIIVRGETKCFALPAKWLVYEISDTGKILFEREWNNTYGGETKKEARISDNFTFGDRIVKRILLCAAKCKTDERKRQEFHRKMLAAAAKVKKRTGLTQKYKEPPLHLPREGVKKRNW